MKTMPNSKPSIAFEVTAIVASIFTFFMFFIPIA